MDRDRIAGAKFSLTGLERNIDKIITGKAEHLAEKNQRPVRRDRPEEMTDPGETVAGHDERFPPADDSVLVIGYLSQNNNR